MLASIAASAVWQKYQYLAPIHLPSVAVMANPPIAYGVGIVLQRTSTS